MREKIEMIDLQLDQKEKVLTCLTKLYQSLEFFYQLANDNNLSKENVKTHMELFESYFTELSGILGYDSVIAEERGKTLYRDSDLAGTAAEKLGRAKQNNYHRSADRKIKSLGWVVPCLVFLIRIPLRIPGKDHTKNVPVHGHTGIGKRTFLQLCPKRMQEIYGRMGNCSNQQKRRLGHF